MAADTHEDVDYTDNGRRARDYGNDLEDIGQSTTEIINIDTTYQPAWGPAEGFRENYQNWKDGIMRSFKLSEKDFKVECVSRSCELFYPVYHPPGKDKLIGYMRFKYDSKKLGTLEITNFNASLQRRHLGIGGTTKADDSGQLGQHGEGLKLSALVNRRHPHNYGFTIYSTGCKWTFGWNMDKKLNCRIQRIPRSELSELKEEAAERDDNGLPREAKGRAWEDVSIIIGESRRCRSLKGDVTTTAKIPLAVFQEWLKITIDISPPTQIVRTSAGDLILDPSYANKLYLHGLQLPGGSKSGRSFTFGYNLLNVKTGRDRDSTADAAAESSQIFEIWKNVLLKQNEGDTTYLAKYTDLLRNHLHKSADVFDVEDHISREIASKVWSMMLKENVNGKTNFYYEAGEDSYDAEIIHERLKKHPVALNNNLWKIFRNRELCNTPREEQRRLFKNAKPVTLPSNPFSDSVLFGLKALMAIDVTGFSARLTIVSAKDLGIDVYYQRNDVLTDEDSEDEEEVQFNDEFKVEESCFTHEKAHAFAYCEDSTSEITASGYVFTCDHAILSIYDAMLGQLSSQGLASLPPNKVSMLRSTARAKIQQMPRAVTLETNEKRNALYISWTSVEPCNKARKPVKVTLHSTKCTASPSKRWNEKLVYSPTCTRKCSCPSKISVVDGEYVAFTELDQNLKYYAMVSRDNEDAIYGMIPGPKAPSDPSLAIKHFQAIKSVDTSISPLRVSAMFSQSKTPEGWSTISHNELFKDGFPYAQTWLTSQKHDPQIFIAKSKPSNVRADLKRVLEDDSSDQATKKAKP